MFKINFSIHNPLFKPKEDFESKTYFHAENAIGPTTAYNVQLSRFDTDTIFSVQLDTSWRGEDHAGPRLDIELFGVTLFMQLYDSRHWNYDAGRWYEPGEEAAEWRARNNS